MASEAPRILRGATPIGGAAWPEPKMRCGAARALTSPDPRFRRREPPASPAPSVLPVGGLDTASASAPGRGPMRASSALPKIRPPYGAGEAGEASPDPRWRVPTQGPAEASEVAARTQRVENSRDRGPRRFIGGASLLDPTTVSSLGTRSIVNEISAPACHARRANVGRLQVGRLLYDGLGREPQGEQVGRVGHAGCGARGYTGGRRTCRVRM